MKLNSYNMLLRLKIFVFVLLLTSNCYAEEFFIDPAHGKDSGKGTASDPFATLAKAVNTADALEGTGTILIRLMPGIYNLTDKITLNPRRSFSKSERIIIEAVFMPDDKGWNPGSMPVITSVADTSVSWGFGCSVGIMIATNHVTIRGLKFIGNPNPNVAFYYPIGREGQTLEDLEISQRVFIGERFSAPVQVAVLTNGHQTTIDHCIFYNCRNAVVFWRVEKTQRNNSMTHCIIYGAYQAGIWTAKPDSNFEFSNNVISHCNFAWIKNYYNEDHYSFHDCVITENTHYRGEWQQPDTLVEVNGNRDDLTEINITKHGTVRLVNETVAYMQDEIPVDYLNLNPGSLGYELNAGLFRRRKD